jgi:hypothetical protein
MPTKGSTGNDKLRTNHRAYDIYKTGGGNVPVRYRCLLRRKKISISIDDEEFKAMLPDEIWCPMPERDDAVVIIDAIFDRRLSYLIDIKKLHFGHSFGFETFLDYAERKAGLSGDRLDAQNGFLVLPSCEIEKRTLFKKTTHGPITVAVTILTFADGDRFFEVKCSARNGMLTKMHLDPESGLYKIMEHYPNAYRFLKLDPIFPWKLFKLPLKTLDPDKRMGYQSHGDPVESAHAETSTRNK